MLASVVVDTAIDVANGNTSSIAALIANPGPDGVISLREAILAANNTLGLDEITFAPALVGQTITLGGIALPTLTDHLNIHGGSGVTISGAGASHIVDVASSTVVRLTNLTLANGNRFGAGGAITNQGFLTLTSVDIQNNAAMGGGGGIFNRAGGYLLLEQVDISNNTVFGNGGGIYNEADAEIFLQSTSIDGNTATLFGGGLSNDGILTVTAGSNISGNVALGGAGGGIFNNHRLSVFDSTIADNEAIGSTAAGVGGGIANYSFTGDVTLDGVTLRGNRAVGANGADGSNGSNGSAGYRNWLGSIIAPGVGGPGTPGGDGYGALGGGLFSLTGNVYLYDSVFDSNIAQGGNGGKGGAGGRGGNGAPGDFYNNQNQWGGLAAQGGVGAPGGAGANAAGGGLYIHNLYDRTIQWAGLMLVNNEALGGTGGTGGAGGAGGTGGTGAHAFVGFSGELHNSTSGGGGWSGGEGGSGGTPGAAQGGGLFYITTSSGTLNLYDSAITGNRAVGAAGGAGGNGGGSGSGGAGGNGAPGHSSILNGDVGGSASGFARRGGEGITGGIAEGGGIRHAGGTLNLFNTTMASNEAIGGTGGPKGENGPYGQGGLGGIAAPGGTNGPQGNAFHHGIEPPDLGNGGRGTGGGIHLSNAAASLSNTTFALNLAAGGETAPGTGQSLVQYRGGDGLGGGLYVTQTAVTSNHATLSGNQVRPGAGDGTVHNKHPGSIAGGGIWTDDTAGTSITLNHTIVAGNLALFANGTIGPSNLFGKPVEAGSAYNLVGTGGDGGLTNGVNSNLVGIADPLLGPLADNGGPTQTMLPLVGSPAIDAGDPFFNPATFDQRGLPRVVKGGPQTETNGVVGLAEIKFGTTGGQVVTPVDVFASSYWGPSQTPANLINGAGLDTSSGNVMMYTHAPHGSAHGMWATGNGQGVGGADPIVAGQYVVLDLGANYDLSQAYLWQMVQTNLLGRGIKEFRLYGSPDAPSAADKANPPAEYDLTGYSLLVDTTLGPPPSSGPSITQAIALSGATNVRTIYLEVQSNYNTSTLRTDIGAVEAPLWFVATDGEFFVDGSQPKLRITFNGVVDGTSVAPSDVLIERVNPFSIPPFFVAATGVSADGATITFDLPTDMMVGATFRATLPTGSVVDAAGNSLLTDLSFNFIHTPYLPGDYNHNGAVDAADYVLWRKSQGALVFFPYTGADGSGNGQVGPEDHGVWAANFGSTSASGVGAAAEQSVTSLVSAATPNTVFQTTAMPNPTPSTPLAVESRDEALHERVWSGIALTTSSLRTIASNPAVALSQLTYATLSDHHDGALLAWLTAWDGPSRTSSSPTTTDAWQDEELAETPAVESDALDLWDESVLPANKFDFAY